MDSFVLFVVATVTWVNASYLAHLLLPLWGGGARGTAVAYCCVQTFIIAVSMRAYYLAIVTHPGRVPHLWVDRHIDSPATPQLIRAGSAESGAKGGLNAYQHRKRYCPTCSLWKPPRTHHCSVCKQCVLRYDHHCPWIANCVGFFNHKYFMLLITYLPIACGFIAATGWDAAVVCTPRLIADGARVAQNAASTIGSNASTPGGSLPPLPPRRIVRDDGAVGDFAAAPAPPALLLAGAAAAAPAPPDACALRGLALVNFCLSYWVAVFFGFLLILFASQHWLLMLQNKTTVEALEQEGPEGHIYDLGWRVNFTAACGARWWRWPCPVPTHLPSEHGGTTFAVSRRAAQYQRRQDAAGRDAEGEAPSEGRGEGRAVANGTSAIAADERYRDAAGNGYGGVDRGAAPPDAAVAGLGSARVRELAAAYAAAGDAAPADPGGAPLAEVACVGAVPGGRGATGELASPRPAPGDPRGGATPRSGCAHSPSGGAYSPRAGAVAPSSASPRSSVPSPTASPRVAPPPSAAPALNTPAPALNTPAPALNTPAPALNTPAPALNTPGPTS